jgi:hypothetical protein
MGFLEKKIVDLYTKERLSVQQIKELLGVSQYRICRSLEINGVHKRTISDAVTAHHITRFGLKEFKIKEKLSRDEELLKTAGLMLYWGEGAKTHGSVALSNSNPMIVKLFLKFLRQVCGVAEDRLHVSLHYYADQNPDALKQFWSEETGIPICQFYKPHLQIRSKGTYRTPSQHGTVILSYSDKKLFNLILGWMDECYEKLIGV